MVKGNVFRGATIVGDDPRVSPHDRPELLSYIVFKRFVGVVG